MIQVLYAHPYPSRSRGCAALLAAVSKLDDVEVRSLYDIYPDFDIDRRAEQAALRRASAIVLLNPLHWYGVPALLKHWFDKVLLEGFAYGRGGDALRDMPCLWATTTGGGEYREGGTHDHPFSAFVPPIEMTARYCGMTWQEPFVVHGVSKLSDDELRDAGVRLARRLEALKGGAG